MYFVGYLGITVAFDFHFGGVQIYAVL